MNISFKERIFKVEYQPIILASVILGWSIYYYLSTINTPDGGAKSVLFIRPLAILLLICYPFVIARSLKIVTKSEAIVAGISEEVKETDRGFLDQRRIVFSVSLIIYAIGLTFIGYLIPTILFVFLLCYYLGVRNIWVLLLMPTLLPVLLLIVFKLIIGVPMPVWPWSN